DDYDWKGFVRFDRMPEVVNPEKGIIVTAINKIIDDAYPYHISNHWEPPWRAERITEVLQALPKATLQDMGRLQFDVVSPHARKVVPRILAASRPTDSQHDPRIATALKYLANWDFSHRPDEVAPTIFQATFLKIIDNTLKDDLGPQLLGLYDTLASIPLTVLTRLLEDSTSTWFDDITTSQIESRDDIVRKSLAEALAGLQQTLGGEIKEWRWGRVHAVTFGHVFGANAVLRPIFNIGPFSVGGSHSTVSKGDFRLAQPFANTIGPSTRRIYDLADMDGTLAVMPPGQSGHVFSGHYKDQINLWLHGAYRFFPMSVERWNTSSAHRLLLTPEQ
ncbi:MAG: penicillin acylase family protein, partial [Ignavibacteriales bacterium]|nr:penicillin acylase family protein [Ignavibacteriales bacterium]